VSKIIPIETIQSLHIEHPKHKEMGGVVPEIIKKNIDIGRKIRFESNEGYVLFMRRALEGLCKDQKAKGKTLFEQLNDLIGRDVIPPILSDATSIIRKIGNMGAHETESEIPDDYVDAVEEFISILIKYIYVIPEQIINIGKML